jgi:RNA polymerase sigma-70 factor (ECF subfamily)
MISASALENIYRQFHDDLHRFILRRVADPYTAEDILQDVYLKIHAYIDDLREGDRLEDWLYRIIRNAIIDHYRRDHPRLELSEHLERLEADDRDAVAEIALSVRAMLACLPGKYRQALILAEYRGLRQHEIAGRLDVSPSEAESFVQRGREMLREALLDYCHFEFDRRGRAISYQPHCAACADNADL